MGAKGCQSLFCVFIVLGPVHTKQLRKRTRNFPLMLLSLDVNSSLEISAAHLFLTSLSQSKSLSVTEACSHIVIMFAIASTHFGFIAFLSVRQCNRKRKRSV